MAAALAAGASVLVTANLRDFPTRALGGHGVPVCDCPETYLVELLEHLPDELAATVVRVAAERARPPMTPEDLLEAPRRSGLKEFPTRIARLLSGPPTPPPDDG
jgi:hypothetical protein